MLRNEIENVIVRKSEDEIVEYVKSIKAKDGSPRYSLLYKIDEDGCARTLTKEQITSFLCGLDKETAINLLVKSSIDFELPIEVLVYDKESEFIRSYIGDDGGYKDFIYHFKNQMINDYCDLVYNRIDKELSKLINEVEEAK